MRIGRVVHWTTIGVALFGLPVSLYGMMQAEEGEPLAFFAVVFMWAALIMIGRAIRYILANE